MNQKLIKDFNIELDAKVKAQYSKLSDAETVELLVTKKWYYTIYSGIDALYTAISHDIANRIVELAERYEDTLPSLEKAVGNYESKVKLHLAKMGFAWGAK